MVWPGRLRERLRARAGARPGARPGLGLGWAEVGLVHLTLGLELQRLRSMFAAKSD